MATTDNSQDLTNLQPAPNTETSNGLACFVHGECIDSMILNYEGKSHFYKRLRYFRWKFPQHYFMLINLGKTEISNGHDY